MNLLSLLFSKAKQEKKKKEDLHQEALIKQGREQFKRLVEKGLQLPIVVL